MLEVSLRVCSSVPHQQHLTKASSTPRPQRSRRMLRLHTVLLKPIFGLQENNNPSDSLPTMWVQREEIWIFDFSEQRLIPSREVMWNVHFLI